MLRAIVGLIKGFIVGGGVGFALLKLTGDGESNTVLTYAACAIVGALVGVICGRAPWRSETVWTPIVKSIVGGIVGAGLCALGRKFLPDMTFTVAAMKLSIHHASVLSVAVGVLYGIFVEVDDGGSKPDSDGKNEAAKPARRP